MDRQKAMRQINALLQKASRTNDPIRLACIKNQIQKIFDELGTEWL